MGNDLVVICLEFCNYFLVVIFSQEALQQESQEVWESVELPVEADIAVC